MNNGSSTNTRSLSVDGFRPKTAPPGQAAYSNNGTVNSRLAPQRQPSKRDGHARPQPIKRERRFLKKMELPLLVAIGMIGGLLADNTIIGMALLVVYGIVAFTTRIPSRTTFTLTLLLLAAISVSLLLKPSPQLIQNFASYTFVLLLIGVITLGREAKMPKRMRPKRRR